MGCCGGAPDERHLRREDVDAQEAQPLVALDGFHRTKRRGKEKGGVVPDPEPVLERVRLTPRRSRATIVPGLASMELEAVVVHLGNAECADDGLLSADEGLALSGLAPALERMRRLDDALLVETMGEPNDHFERRKTGVESLALEKTLDRVPCLGRGRSRSLMMEHLLLLCDREKMGKNYYNIANNSIKVNRAP